MKLFSSFLLAAGMAVFSSASVAEDQTGFQFEEGSVLIHCAAPKKEDMISTEIFNEAYPIWITRLQEHANEGRIARAHYLGELRQGIFIVVVGKDLEEARANAEMVQSENMETFKAAVEAAGGGYDINTQTSCQILEVGPAAILPQ